MDQPFYFLFIPSLLMIPAMGLLSRLESEGCLAAEIRRKALHVGVGLMALTFPLFLTNGWRVIAAFALVSAWLLAVRTVPSLQRRFGCVLNAGRLSYGELYFSLSVAGLLLMSGSVPVLYVVPLLVLTVADAVAAIVGRAWPRGRLGGPAGGKTMSGCCAFCLCAFVIASAGLKYLTGIGGIENLAIAGSLSLLTGYVEAISSRGIDNLAVPAVAWLVLYSSLGGA